MFVHCCRILTIDSAYINIVSNLLFMILFIYLERQHIIQQFDYSTT